MSDDVIEAVEHLVTGIVSDQDAVSVEESTNRRGTTLHIRVAPDDLGRVIGRGGRTATAIRTIVGALAGPKIRVDVVDTDSN